MQETANLTPVKKRPLHRMIWQFVRSTIYFWVPAFLFLVLANEVGEKEPLPGDVAILNGIHTFSSDWLDRFFLLVTSLGSAPFVIAGVTVAITAMYYIGEKRNALFLLFSAGGTAIINILFKLLFERERPDLWEHLVIESGYSFPSGHAMISSALALAIIILAWRTEYRWHAIIIGSLYTLLVGISRVYLGVHFPSDIIGGWCVSILWILTLYHVFARFTGRARLSAK